MTVITISFRAECKRDVQDLERRLEGNGIKFTRSQHKQDDHFPDVEVEYHVEATLERVKYHAGKITDGHVMVETMRECSLYDNPLKRSYV